jgi:hypothetical protein
MSATPGIPALQGGEEVKTTALPQGTPKEQA